MTQLELRAPARQDTHAVSLERVTSRIAGHALAFCRLVLADRFVDPGQFRMEELRQYVDQAEGRYVAPDSAGRILRDLKQRGLVGYTLISRRESLYRAEWVR